MVILTQEMKDMVNNNQCYIGTVSKDGAQNVAPKRSTRVLDDQTLLFTEGTGGQTYRNVLDGSKAVVAVANRDINDGFRFVGTTEVKDSGELYEKSTAFSAANGMAKPKAVVLIHVEEIYALKPSMAGQRIE